MLLGELSLKARATEASEHEPRHEYGDCDHYGAVRVLVHLPSDGGEVRGHGRVVHRRSLEAVSDRIDEGWEEGEEVGQDSHRPCDLPVDVFAGSENAPEPVGDHVHAGAFALSLFMLVFKRLLPDERLSGLSAKGNRTLWK